MERKQTVIMHSNVNVLAGADDDEDESSVADDGYDYALEAGGGGGNANGNPNPNNDDDDDDDEDEDNPNNHNSSNPNNNNNNSSSGSGSSSAKHSKKDSLSVPNPSQLAQNKNVIRRKSSSSMASMVQEQIQSLMMKNNGNNMDPTEEMEREMKELSADRQLFSDLFEKIDSSGNGDLDLNEWLDSLTKVGVIMSDEDKETIFKYMDIEVNEYVQKDDFVGFCVQKFRSEKLTQLQTELISQIRGTMHSRQPSNLVRADTGDKWDEIEMHAMHKEMSQHIVNLATNLNDSIDKEEKFYEEIERRAQEPDFAKAENALNWNPQEVAWWLDSIDFGQHARKFFEESVDGSILLNDIDGNFLKHEFGIKALHVKKILREIDKLRKLNQHDLDTPYKDWHQLSRENERMIEQLKLANSRIKELEAENAKLRLNVMNPSGSQMNLMGGGAAAGGLGGPGDLGGMNMFSSTMIHNPLAGGMQVGIVNTDTGLIIDPLSDTFDTSMVTNKDAFIEALIRDIKALHEAKIKLAENTDQEIQSLRQIIRVLAGEYQTLTTPMYKSGFDGFMGLLGYQKR